MIIEQIRHLQAKRPFEPFALELDNSRIIQLYDPYQLASREGQRVGREAEAVIGILHHEGSFEFLDASHVVSVSAGVHPQIQAELDQRMERAKKILGAGQEQNATND
jgi:hypothetical protein